MRKRLTERGIQSASGIIRREIPDDYEYDKKQLRHLKRILQNVNSSLETLISALNEFSRIKGPDISPDGLLGGLGYVLSIKEIKEIFNGTIKNISNVADSLADELTNPRWEAKDDKDIKKLIKEKEEIEEKAEELEDSTELDLESEVPEESEKPEESEEPEESKAPEEVEEQTEPKETDLELENDLLKKSDMKKADEINPNDVVTNVPIINKKAYEKYLYKAVQESLVKFSSVGSRTKYKEF